MLASFIGALLIQAYNVENSMKNQNKQANKPKKRPYYDAKEVIIEEVVEDE